jgi:hypothetical protein
MGCVRLRWKYDQIAIDLAPVGRLRKRTTVRKTEQPQQEGTDAQSVRHFGEQRQLADKIFIINPQRVRVPGDERPKAH